MSELTFRVIHAVYVASVSEVSYRDRKGCIAIELRYVE